MTSTAVGWVLVEGRDADGTILDHDEFAARTGGGLRAVKTSKQVTDAVSHADATANARDRRLHAIGVTWSDDAAAEAALVVESLTAAGFDNVVPVRSLQAAETLARGLAPVIGYDTTAVCVLEQKSATVAMVDVCDGETRTTVKQVLGGADGLVRWLAKMFDRSGWQPDGVVVVGSDADLEGISWQLDDALPVPVFTQSGAELALARGAALVSAQGVGFGDAQQPESVDSHSSERVWSRPMSYAGALTVLVAAAVTFVASVSLAVGLRIASDKGAEPVVRASASHHVAEAPIPSPAAVKPPRATAGPPSASVPEPRLAQSPGSHAEQPSARPPVAAPVAPPPAPVAPPPAPVAPPPQEPVAAPVAPPEPDQHPLLTRVLDHMRGHRESASEQPAPNNAPPSP